MKHILLLAATAVLFSSCEKIVNIDLNTSNPQYVVEAELFEGEHPFVVHLALTTDYYGRAPQQSVNDAVVVLTSTAGDSVEVPSVGEGRYELPSFEAIAGVTYQLRILAGEKEFTAASTLQPAVPIDSVTYEYKDDVFDDAGYEVYAHFFDPAERDNYYRMIVTVNDTLKSRAEDLDIFNDKFNNGNHVRGDLIGRYRLGDTVEIELRTMDEPVFTYFTTLRQVLMNQSGPAPSNPVSNIKGGALGYFGAFARNRASVVITE